MKIRAGFVTNSSATLYMVRNTSDRTKTVLDLMKEAARGDWYYRGVLGRNHRVGFDGVEVDKYSSWDEFQEAMERERTIPPHGTIEIWIWYSDGGPFFCMNGLHEGQRGCFIIKGYH